MTGLEPTRLMRHRHLKLALSVCGTSSASTKSKISCCGTSSAFTKSKISCCGTSSATTKSKIWCNSATAVLKCISNKKTSRISTTCFGRGDRTRTCGILLPNGPMKALSAKNSFFRPFLLGKPRSSALPNPLLPSAPKR